MAFLDPIFNPWLLPLLEWHAFFGILLIAFFISVLVTVVYKYTTNQTDMKRMKDQQKEFQAKMKSLRDKPDEMMRVQKEAMKVNFEYMKQSFKPTLITMLPILLIFGWMAGHLSYEPIHPGESYRVTAFFKETAVGNATLVAPNGTEVLSPLMQLVSPQLSWNLKTATVGEHLIGVELGEVRQSKPVLISERLEYADEFAVYQHSDIEKIQINYEKLQPLRDLSIFGWYPGWLALYIIFSLVFSIGLRKVMKVY